MAVVASVRDMSRVRHHDEEHKQFDMRPDIDDGRTDLGFFSYYI